MAIQHCNYPTLQKPSISHIHEMRMAAHRQTLTSNLQALGTNTKIRMITGSSNNLHVNILLPQAVIPVLPSPAGGPLPLKSGFNQIASWCRSGQLTEFRVKRTLARALRPFF